MRIYAVTPIHVDAEELARRQARYAALAPPGVEVVLHDLGPDAPRALDTDAQVRRSEELVVAALRGAPAGFDALLPDCVLDPGVADLAGTLPVPVLGLLRLSLGWAVLTGRRCAAVARNRAIADEMVARARVYGWSADLLGVEVLDLDVHAIADTARWADALGGVVATMAADGARTVINGCSAVDVPAGVTLPARVVDPTALALRLIAAGEVTPS
ncbi:aspartate/glutamate racemase family protein [Micromonospora sp. WMMD1128]|uniref:aspartate/glutamate racemase family protein n=1 Tax=unclassified Micromonospora TaxID=2617518 RepID=UPI00248C109A|nr:MULTISPECIES: aspartate/glutamate racemase family protein [unclassified Micromonospora]WBB75887.1 aspartate/glutamate racemase family protein [Micromonospora sp. WMMD1128]WFE36324.1 aspartate/glutamate racemase family protein [Micromonospora sp. WMMD975]